MALAGFAAYSRRLSRTLDEKDWSAVARLAHDLEDARDAKRQVFLCGNGGSAANAQHIANDLVYGAKQNSGIGLRAHALSANQSVITCLANDTGYANIFSGQLEVLAGSGDLLIVLSGSGNSANIITALETAKRLGLKSWAILGYSGGRALQLADDAVHFCIDDMQIAEDCQLVVGHMLMRYLCGKL